MPLLTRSPGNDVLSVRWPPSLRSAGAVLLLDRFGCVALFKNSVNLFIFSSFMMNNTKNGGEVHKFPSPVYECQGKSCRRSAFPAKELYFWNGDERHDAGWYCSACLSWKNVGTVELVTLAEAFIETIQDKTESNKVNEQERIGSGGGGCPR